MTKLTLLRLTPIALIFIGKLVTSFFRALSPEPFAYLWADICLTLTAMIVIFGDAYLMRHIPLSQDTNFFLKRKLDNILFFTGQAGTLAILLWTGFNPLKGMVFTKPLGIAIEMAFNALVMLTACCFFFWIARTIIRKETEASV